jgi:hypothetical protein
MPPPYTAHQDQPTIATANEHYEVHTSLSGTESDTDAFRDTRPESELLNHVEVGRTDAAHARHVTYDGAFIGTFRTATKGSGRANSLVKMHLVNSYLHPNANTWPGNWFWGSFDLNKLHNGFEEAAKKCHPTYTGPGAKGAVLLRYATRRGGLRPNGLALAEFKLAVVIKLTRLRNQTVGVETALALDEAKIKIGSFDLDTFHAAWLGAIASCAASSIEVRYSHATKKADALEWSVETVSPATGSQIAGEIYQPDIMAHTDSGAVWLNAFPLASRKRKADDAPDADKKAKLGQ